MLMGRKIFRYIVCIIWVLALMIYISPKAC